MWAAAFNLGQFDMILRDTLDYITVRNTFGKPISTRQAVQFRLAELQSEV